MTSENPDKFSVEIVETEIHGEQILQAVRSEFAGANILFLGTVRSMTNGQETTRLEYECHSEMAIHQFKQLCREACTRWPIEKLKLVHRIGPVAIGESSIAIAISTAHRAQAFEASQWLMDSIKKSVPIWKKEHSPNGNSHWVHHGDKPSTPNSTAHGTDQ